jgi:phosphoglycerate dehydrogenase-like enzyme
MTTEAGAQPGPRVLLLHVALSNPEPAGSAVIAALDGVPFQVFDADQPIAPQMQGKSVVIDIGGWGRAEHVRAAAAAGVQLWQVFGYGLDHLAYDEVVAAGIPLARTPGSTTAVALAEHAMFLILSVEKQAAEARRALELGEFWNGDAGELAGKTIAVIGLGASGGELARRARAFDMCVLGVDVVDIPQSTLTEMGVSSCVGIDRLHDVLAESDVVSLHLPLLDDTLHLVGTAEFGVLKPGAILINVARGALVDEAAMIAALRNGSLRGAGLDVFEVEPLPPDHPLLSMPNVVLTPHWAGATRGVVARRSEVVADNARRVLAGEPPLHLVAAAVTSGG